MIKFNIQLHRRINQRGSKCGKRKIRLPANLYNLHSLEFITYILMTNSPKI